MSLKDECKVSRNHFLNSAVLLLEGLLENSSFKMPRTPKVERSSVVIDGLCQEFDGFTICQITDVHYGRVIGPEYLDAVVGTANALSPDLTVLTGDYIDKESKYLGPAIKGLSRLRARHGLLSVLGNHEHFHCTGGKGYAADVLDNYGIPLLDNSHATIEYKGSAICVAGTADFLYGSPSAEAAFASAVPGAPRILLSHNPDFAETLSPDMEVDLVLSGHTHGGQIRLPFSYAPLLPSEFGQKYSGGLVNIRDEHPTLVYVSRGIGVCAIPLRLNCPPEITLLTLRAGRSGTAGRNCAA